MAGQQGERIRVILRKVQINDALEPFFDSEGEFRFSARVSSRGGVVQETKIPKQGHFLITDHPSWNQKHLNEVIFEGEVADHLEIEIAGEELDLGSSDHLPTYRRIFEGDPASWIGVYRPGDEGPADPEKMKEWWVFLEVEKA